MKNIALKVALLEWGISQFQLAHQLGCHPSVVSRIVNGWERPDDGLKDQISHVATQVTMAMVVTGSSKEKTESLTKSTRQGMYG